ncbi:2-succinyl-6-hydroxy-2,4-cyclohexadiene-1-carboxylate synthase [Melghirimyces algeriensis]|uniref:Putative 2-succinyl-6-hydroxy-2,4-cyclohexadiene-1-carboxylate synthase n=1 Tax=Melghirimyces algeriensis TaxID=910412 RepID=A0A521F0U1_9BACL|nr:2-succinyl-6-hydroxy-2,4-cyclohexadiene-1-carboxylate synthase [Melghirimyces algeriensis]SMO89808.1 2-succinyl-6-hydroxy-2,4-cyclohexadiene-1-carboxylate synthase [Melghirimyces algeriensis]
MRMDVNGIQYHLAVKGEGPPLLLLHGFTGSLNTFAPFVPSWSRSHRVIRLDLIGHGQTDAPQIPDRYTMEEVGKDLRVILDQLEIKRTHILGYSMGGRLALSFALMYPERVESLLLESSSPGLRTEAERRARRKQDASLADWIEREGMEAFVRYWEGIPLFSTQKRLSERVRRHIREERLANRAEGLAGSLRGMGTGRQPSWWDHLQCVKQPVALITGEEDQKFCRIADAMEQGFPFARQWRVSRAGHAVHVEQPHIFDKIVKGFLLAPNEIFFSSSKEDESVEY